MQYNFLIFKIYIVALMQYCHNSDFGRFELSIQVDCTFDDNFFGKNVTFVASKLAATGQSIFCLLFNVYDF